MNYPERLIRGISSPDDIDPEGRAAAPLFLFSDNSRQDGLHEASINWYDNDEALEMLMKQKKQGREEYQFKTGAAIMLRCWLDDAINRPNCNGALLYERNEIIGDNPNPYHGNILRKPNLTKQINNVLACSLAMCVEKIVYRQAKEE